jgi:GNAT superfamily N-acetyltransferase
LTESEAALAGALTVIGRLPAAEVATEPDASWVASGRPWDSFNHVMAIELTGPDAAVERRIDDLDAALRRRRSVPATWWIGPSTRPADLARRLGARGFLEADEEYGMAIDVAAAPSPAGDIAEVVDAGGVDEFLGIMAGAYGWADDARSAAWAELYRLPIPTRDRPWAHVVVRRGDLPAACASLFTAGGHAFVTNVGTLPGERGAGLGTAATLAVLRIAARLGHRRATLTASRMGRGVYARIGFREDGVLERRISPGAAGGPSGPEPTAAADVGVSS